MKIKKSFFRGFAAGFKQFSHHITNVINFVLLAIVYFIGIGPVSIIAKLFKKHFLTLKSEKPSYWSEHKKVSKNIDDYYRTF